MGPDDGFTINRIVHKLALARTAGLVAEHQLKKGQKKDLKKDISAFKKEMEEVYEEPDEISQEYEEKRDEYQQNEKRINILSEADTESPELSDLLESNEDLSHQMGQLEKTIMSGRGTAEIKEQYIEDLQKSI